MLKKEKFMKEAIKQAKKAYDKEEIPVGAVIVKDGKIIARGYNKKEEKKDTTQHAEIIAIQKASRKIGAWRLQDCEMYVTLEPCAMCTGALIPCGVSSENVRSPHPHPPRCKQESSHPATFPSPGRMQQRKTKENTQQQKAEEMRKKHP